MTKNWRKEELKCKRKITILIPAKTETIEYKKNRARERLRICSLFGFSEKVFRLNWGFPTVNEG